MKKHFVIAIDGASSTGKSTLAKGLAKALDLAHVDSGAMYRGITLYAQQNGLLVNNKLNTKALLSQLDDINLYFEGDTFKLNGVDVSTQIRSMQVSEAVSLVATIPEIRSFLVAQQRIIGTNQSVVMDGRDIGTVVFPKADLKLFLVADVNIRVQRRFDELNTQNTTTSVKEVFNNLVERDHLDSTRADSPLVQADDAILLDATQFTVESMLDHVLDLVAKRLG
ncbi:MAG: (d)CMP kinase [Flavobacteriaceae bacterium]|nr:cytidylate kinase [Flavobacteriaceae bacterium]|tara:strand:+ start:898 stop:1569 length:672 start_codon:yes stop_codon:yes gene_type:complete